MPTLDLRPLFQANAKLAVTLVGDESIGDLAKCVLDGLLVSEQRLVVLSFGNLEVGSQTSAGEQRKRNGGTKLPHSGGSTEHVGKGDGLIAIQPGKTHRWKEGGLGLADVRVGSDHLLFG